jgi:site-specific DNA recombinase
VLTSYYLLLDGLKKNGFGLYIFKKLKPNKKLNDSFKKKLNDGGPNSVLPSIQDVFIQNILTNPHYLGDLVQGRSTTRSVTNKSRDQNNPQDYLIVPNTHEAIISRKDFEAVQQLIKSRKRTHPQAEKHLFTNTAYCSDCGRGMHYKANSKGYICGNYNKHGVKACSNHLIREADLHAAILHDLQILVSSLNKH